MRAIAREEAARFFDEATFVRKFELDQIVDKAVHRTLQTFGIDTNNPTDVQENFINLRSWSDLKKALAQSFVTTLTRSVTLGILALLILGFYSWMSGHKFPP